MRRRKPPDKRLDWRDPNMPCIRIAKDDLTGQLSVEFPSPELVSAVASEDLKYADKRDYPNWRDDPTYNLFKHKRKL